MSSLGLKRWESLVHLYRNLAFPLSLLKHNSRRDITLPLWRVTSKTCEKMVSMGMLHGIEHCWTSLSPNFACDGDFESSWAAPEIDVINWWWIIPWKNRDEHLWAVFFNLLLFDSLTCTGSRGLAMISLGLKRWGSLVHLDRNLAFPLSPLKHSFRRDMAHPARRY